MILKLASRAVNKFRKPLLCDVLSLPGPLLGMLIYIYQKLAADSHYTIDRIEIQSKVSTFSTVVKGLKTRQQSLSTSETRI